MLDERICKGCGKKFRPARVNQVYCDKHCRKRAYYREHKGTSRGWTVCPVCGKKFELHYNGQVCCSRKCAAAKLKMSDTAKKTKAANEAYVKIMITTEVPVFEKMRPKVGCIYEAEIGKRGSTHPECDFFIIGVNGYDVIIHGDECAVIE